MTDQFRLLRILAFIAAAAASQNTPPPPPPLPSAANSVALMGAGSSSTSTLGVAFGGLSPITGKPLSVEQVTDRVQTLADGTRITQASQKTLLYRDSEGRTRMEHLFTPPPGVAMVSGPSFIQIADPVAGFRYVLNKRDHTAQRMPYGPVAMGNSAARPAADSTQAPAPSSAQQPSNLGQGGSMGGSIGTSPGPASGPHPNMSHESLGTQNIDGLTAEGRRTTTTYPEGSFGNDRPVTVVTETWISHDLRMVVLSKSSDPRNGDSTTKLENLSQTEPDPALFQVPADYTVTEIPRSPAGASIVNK